VKNSIPASRQDKIFEYLPGYIQAELGKSKNILEHIDTRLIIAAKSDPHFREKQTVE